MGVAGGEGVVRLLTTSALINIFSTHKNIRHIIILDELL